MCNVQEANDRPKWLLELESRKRKPRLAHEAGAGAPCMICNADCPGLDLHFWRKICKNCKCSRDDHDFEDDDFPQFDMLFGPTKKFKRKPVSLRVNNEKQHEGEATFEWVPPNTTKELATDYMKALPLEKLPIKGSAGAALRRQLLQKQLPLHDIDHKACDELSEQEKKQFEKYLENIKNYVGQGKVTKVLGARPFDRSLMTPANATDMQRFSPQNKPNIPASTIQLRTPSSFNPKTSYMKNLNDNQNKQESPNVRKMPVLEKYNVLSSCNSSETAKSEPVKNGIYNKTSTPLNCGKIDFNSQNPATAEFSVANDDHFKYPPPPVITNTGNTEIIPGTPLKSSRQEYDIVKDPLASLVHSQTINNDAQIAESILADAFLPPSSIHANDIIGSTLDESRLMFIREKLTDKYSNQENQVLHGTPNVARELDGNDLLRRVNNVASNAKQSPNVHGENGRPSIIPGTASEDGTKKAEKDKVETKSIRVERDVIKPMSQLVQSTPLDPSFNNNEAKKEQMKEHALNATHGSSSHPVSSIIEHSDRFPQILNTSTNLSDPTSNSLTKAHSQFPADSYNAKLSSSTAPSNIIHSEKLYNQIFPYGVNDSVQQTQNLPNVEHLKGAIEELTMDSVKPQKCHKCEEEIRVGDVVVTTEKAKNATWHPGCFVCSMCNELLVDLVYFHYKNKLYCGRDLATLLGIPRCFACDELIFVREYTVAEGHNYHVKHFCCWDCDVPLAGQQYITENDRPLCLPCYQKTYAKTCNACKKVIAADQQGVAVKNLNFHAMEECFCCYTCKKNLLNGRMAIKEDRLFCSKECISKFLHPQT